MLRVARPDLVIACYGMNCGIYQPLDGQRFAKFKDGMQRLHDTVEKTGAKIIHLTPPVYDKKPGKPGEFNYDDVLAEYSKWLVSKRADGWIVIDVHGRMKEIIAAARAITDSIRSRRLHLMGRQFNTPEWKSPIDWPKPRVVDPGPPPATPARIPPDAIVLFDGRSLDRWTNGENWKVADGIATVGKGDIQTKQGFGDCQLHVEFRTAADTSGRGQQRSNSGIFLMDTYELQILDSFQDGTDNPVTYFDGQCGALYKQQPPAVNACRRPGEWQTYDILFTRPRFNTDGTLAEPARISVLHNGMAIHSNTVIKGNTFFNAPPSYTAHADALPIRM